MFVKIQWTCVPDTGQGLIFSFSVSLFRIYFSKTFELNLYISKTLKSIEITIKMFFSNKWSFSRHKEIPALPDDIQIITEKITLSRSLVQNFMVFKKRRKQRRRFLGPTHFGPEISKHGNFPVGKLIFTLYPRKPGLLENYWFFLFFHQKGRNRQCKSCISVFIRFV